MNFLNLEYFLAVARELNITKAADNCNLSQQALSKHINNMEKELNMVLFDRSKKVLSLTEAGACFVTYATRILNLKLQMLSQISDIAQRKDSNIRIGITMTRSSVYLPYLLPKFYKMFPEAKVQLTEDASDILFTELQNNKLDIVIGIEPHDKLNFLSIPLCIEDYAIITLAEVINKYLSKSELQDMRIHPERISIESFKKCPFVCFDRTQRVGRIFQDTCRELGFKPQIVIESKSMSTLLYLCAQGFGVTVCPRIYFEIARKQSNIFDHVCVFPLENSPMQTNIVLTVSSDRYIPKLINEFIKIATDEFTFSQGHLNTDTAHFLNSVLLK